MGGVSQVVLNMIAHARQCLGHEPMLIVNDWKAVTESPLAFEKCPASRMRIITPLDAGNPVWTLGSYLARLPGQIMALRRLIRREKVAVINPHFPDLSALTWILAARSFLGPHRPRVVLAFHGQDAMQAISGGWLATQLWKLIFRLVDHVVACSADIADRLSVRFDVNPEALRVVDNGIDPVLLSSEATGEPAHEIGSPYILSLGTFEPKKGHDILLNAFDAIQQRHADLGLVIAGRAGSPEYMEQLESMRKTSPAAARILFLHDLDHAEAMRLLSRARIFALASRIEPFGIAILEAIALGKPVVVTTSCGIVSRVGDGAFTGTVSSDDPIALAASLDSALTHLANLSPGLNETARRVSAEFSWPQVLKQWPERQLPKTETSFSS